MQPFGTAAASLSWTTTAAQMVSLTAGNTTVFTYVYTATSAGQLGLLGLGQRLEPESLNPIASQAGRASTSFGSLLTIQAPANLALASWSLPVQASIGEIADGGLDGDERGHGAGEQRDNGGDALCERDRGLGPADGAEPGDHQPGKRRGAVLHLHLQPDPTAVGSVVLTAQADGLDVNTGLNVRDEHGGQQQQHGHPAWRRA